MTVMTRLAVLLSLLAVPAGATTVEVHGLAEGVTAHVVSLTHQNLRRPDAIQAAARVENGAADLALTAPATLMVVEGCEDPTDVLSCRRYLPDQRRHAPDTPHIDLYVPDSKLADAIWSGAPAPGGPPNWLGWALIALLLVAATFLLRSDGPKSHENQPTAPPPLDTEAPNRKALARGLGPLTERSLIALLAAGLLLPALGSEPLDLLEYSYFHEGLRPETPTAVIGDAISAELAHGPIQPLILRAMAAIDTTPWLLRLPSALFGLLFVLVVARLTRDLPPNAHLAITGIALTAPVAVFYARDATPYALAGLCAAASLLVIRTVEEDDEPTIPRLAALAALQVVGFFSHYGYAFVALSLLVALVIAWRRRPHLLGRALVAFAAAAVLPALIVRPLWTMVVSSGLRFTLMSPAYPDSPGLFAFIGEILTVLTGAGIPVGLVLTLPLWAIGLRALHRHTPTLAWLVGLQALFVVGFLVFSHTMSVAYGGGRVFYAYRWTRPLLLGLLIPIGAAALTRAAPVVALVVVAAAIQSILQLGGVRPDLDAAADYLAEHVQPGDAYAVLPAAFYGDPVQYHLASGAPPGLITEMRTVDLPLGDTTIRGPLVELDLPLATVADRLQHPRIWVIDVHETMFGTAKFRPRDPALDDRTEAVRHELPGVTLTRHDCDLECAWRGGDRLHVDPSNRLRANRYRHAGPGFGEPLDGELVYPKGATVTRLPDGSVELTR